MSFQKLGLVLALLSIFVACGPEERLDKDRPSVLSSEAPPGAALGDQFPAPVAQERPAAMPADLRRAFIAARMAEAGRLLLAKDGVPLLAYSDLYVHDAAGRRLDAWMGVERGAIELRVDDRDAQYPVTVDPLVWAFQAKLMAGGGTANDFFGYSLAVDGDTAVVGAYRENAGSNADQGDVFGFSIAISGDTILVGASQDDIGSNTDQGSAYVFLARFALGDPCTTGAECHSGYCVDHVCCDSACAGQCETCDLAGKLGVCSPVSGDPRGGRAACSGSGVRAGVCDGTNRDACAFPGSGTVCSSASCSNGRATAAGSCDGAGSCNVPAAIACAPYICGEDACLTSCQNDGQCVGGHVCSAGVALICLSGAGLGRPTYLVDTV